MAFCGRWQLFLRPVSNMPRRAQLKATPLNELQAELSKATCCVHGELPGGPSLKDTLLVRTSSGWTNISDSNDLNTLVQACAPSALGKGTRTVVDTNYRNARELTPENVDVRNSLTLANCLAPLVQRSLFPAATVRLEFDKLSVYPEGGFFKAHKDTPVKANLLGSLVVCLPQTFEGGELIVTSPQGDAEILDWAKKSTQSVQWAAFFADCTHEISPVSQGVRVTLHYHVFAEYGEPLPILASEKVKGLLRELLEHSEFDSVAIPLLHQYSLGTIREATRLKEAAHVLLKGADLQLFLALKELLKERGLQPSVNAAFYEESFTEEILVGEVVPENLPFIETILSDYEGERRVGDDEDYGGDAEEDGEEEEGGEEMLEKFGEAWCWQQQFRGKFRRGFWIHNAQKETAGLLLRGNYGNCGVEVDLSRVYSMAVITWEASP